MKHYLTAVAAVSLLLPVIAHADTAVIPTANTNLEGSTGGASITNANARTYQYLIEHSLLTNIPDNSVIDGIAFRLSGTVVGQSKLFADFEIYFGVAATNDNTISPIFADNIVGGNAGRTLVRDGGLSLGADFFPTGGVPAQGIPNPFASAFLFNTATYTYDKEAGNGLIIEIRHTGGGGTSFALDAEETGLVTGGSNYIANSFDATEFNVGGPFIIPQLQFTPAVVPEANTGFLASFALPAIGFLAMRRRKK